MLNERKLTKSELNKREDIIKDMKKNKRALVKKYGKDAEQVMYGRATNIAKKQAETMDNAKIKEVIKSVLMKEQDIIEGFKKLSDKQKQVVQKAAKRGYAPEDVIDHHFDGDDSYLQSVKALMDKDKLREMIKDSLQNPKKADLNKDGKLSDYEKKRGAAIEKSMKKVNEMDSNDPVMVRMRAAKMKTNPLSQDTENIMSVTKNDKKIFVLKKRRDQLMRDMEQEAEPEGGPIADKYGDELNRIDAAIAKLKGQGEWGPERDTDISGEEIAKRVAMIKEYDPDQEQLDDEDEIFIPYDDEGRPLDEGTELYNKDGFYFKRFYGGRENGPSLQITTDKAEYITIPGGKLGLFMSGLEKAVSVFDDMSRQLPVDEDMDLGHEDNEPHMLKADLYRIGKYAMELYQMIDQFEGKGEVDFPHWWQSKIIKSKDALVGAKHYLDFELKEPQIDAMVNVASDEEVIDEAKSLKNLINSVSKKGTLNDVIARVKDIAKKENLDFSDEEIERAVEDSFDRMMGLGENARDKAAMAFDRMKVGNTIKTSKGEFKKIDDKHFEIVGRPGRKFTAKQMTFIKEEAPGEVDMVASDIQKAMNKHKGDKAKTYQLQQARKAMNKGNLEKAKKIAARLAEKLKNN